MLGVPFRLVTLRGGDLAQFLGSSSKDPAAYSSIEEFVFPVVAAGDHDAGAIKVFRNENENGQPFERGGDEYVFGGYYLPGSHVTTIVRDARLLPEQGRRVECVRFVDVGVPVQLLVTFADGRVLLGSEPHDLAPIEKALTTIRTKYRVREAGMTEQP
jgi:hypothetical protein